MVRPASPRIGRLVDHLTVAFLCNLVFSALLLVAFLATRLIESLVVVSLYLIGVSLLMSTPILGGMSWLFDKGSNGSLQRLGLWSIGGVIGMYYGLILGGFLGGSLFGQVGAVIFGLLSFALGQVGGMWLASQFGRRVLGTRFNPDWRPF